jgi:hypothetical protein
MPLIGAIPVPYLDSVLGEAELAVDCWLQFRENVRLTVPLHAALPSLNGGCRQVRPTALIGSPTVSSPLTQGRSGRIPSWLFD